MRRFYTLALSALIGSTCVAAPVQIDDALKAPRLSKANAFSATEQLAKARNAAESAKKQRNAVREAAPSYDDLIMAPEGDKKVYDHMQYTYSTEEESEYIEAAEGLTDVVFGADGEVYIKDPLIAFNCGTYIKGSMEDGLITVQLPQLLYLDGDPDEDPDNAFGYYLEKFDCEWTDDEHATVTGKSENQVLQYYYDESDGSIVMFDCDETWFVGLTAMDEYLGIGASDSFFMLMDYDIVTAPEGLVTEEWVISSAYLGRAMKANVGFDGADVYVQGFSTDDPSLWAKGAVDGDKISFATNQCIGIYANAGMPMFLQGGEFVYDENGVVIAGNLFDSLDFVYDAEKKSMVSQQIAFVSNTTEEIRYFNYWMTPVIRMQPETPTSLKPLTPEYSEYVPFSAATGMGGFAANVPNVSLEATGELYMLDTQKLFWRVYFDDELFTVTPEDYQGVTEEMTNIPYNFRSSYILYTAGLEAFYFFFEGFDTIGVQSVYIDGEEYPSDICVLDVNTMETSVKPADEGSVNTVGDCSEVVSTLYYDLAGRRIERPAKGLYIQKSVMADGSVKAIKVIK